ncbi:MAG: hypothetical protein WC707_00185 [Candidatus Babeliaceae bacterium]|jgi:hypothetical protein
MYKKLFLLASIFTLGSQLLLAEEPVSVEPVSLWEKVREELASIRQNSKDKKTQESCSDFEEIIREEGHTFNEDASKKYAQLTPHDQKKVAENYAKATILSYKLTDVMLNTPGKDRKVIEVALLLSEYNQDQNLQELLKKIAEKKDERSWFMRFFSKK